ncbi:MAG: glycoside hydrolase family 99-like domain-containing protein [Candidatus Aminicenantes bacterium]|nr:glycoside hydrolase family 99-like domain-containing protein [Candidatus Aminicenantes bacterium]
MKTIAARQKVETSAVNTRLLSALLLAAALLGPWAGAARLGAESVFHYQLLVELETTASRAGLTFEQNPTLLAARMTAVTGPYTERGWTLRRFWIRSTGDGQTVSATMVYALSLDATLSPLNFNLEKSSDGESIFRASLIDRDGVPSPLGEWRHQVNASLPVAIDLRRFPAPGLTPPPRYFHEGILPDASPSGLGLAFYYLWYAYRDWSSPYLMDSPLAPYASYERAAMARHIDQAKSAGLSGFIASWWGPDDWYIDRNFGELLDVAAQKGFLVALNFETMDYSRSPAQPRSENTILHWLRCAIDAYGRHPAFLRVNGKPVIVVWVSFAVPLDVWDRVFRQLRSEGREAMFIAGYAGPDPGLEALEVFDGLHNYNILGIVNSNEEVPDILARTYEETGRAVRHHPLLDDEPRPRLWTATAQPGFDDRLLPGRSSPLLPRDNGALFEATFQAAAASRPHWIFVTSWNEWWEHTHIEPSVRYGDQYLRLSDGLFRSWER